MKRLLLSIALLVFLTGCYDGHVRYPCQEQKNWNKKECKVPDCLAEHECTKDLFTEDVYQQIEKVIK